MKPRRRPTRVVAHVTFAVTFNRKALVANGYTTRLAQRRAVKRTVFAMLDRHLRHTSTSVAGLTTRVRGAVSTPRVTAYIPQPGSTDRTMKPSKRLLAWRKRRRR